MASIDNNPVESSAASSPTIQDAGIAAATNLEKTYQDDGPAAAADKLRSEFLDSMKNPVQDGVHMTQLDYEMTKLEVDQGKHDQTLLSCATEWGIQLLQNQGGIDQASLEKLADPAQSVADNGSLDIASAPDPYGQAMAAELDRDWQQLQGFGHTEVNGMDRPKLMLSDLLKNRDVDETIRTYKPDPIKPPGLWEKIEGFFD